MEDRSDKLQTFRIGSREFAIQQSEIATVADWRKPTPLPHAPPVVMGVVSLQGRMLTVLDIGKLIHGEDYVNGTPHHVIALRGDEQLALAVDSIGGEIETSVQGNDSGVTSGVIDHDGQQVEVINVRALFPLAIQGRERRHRRF